MTRNPAQLSVAVPDAARPQIASLRMQCEVAEFGCELRALADDGTVLGSVFLDYHHNELRVLVYANDDGDEPRTSVVLVSDVDAARKGTQ